MSVKRLVRFPSEDVWRSIQDRSELFGRTVGEYLSWLHAVQSKVTPLKVDVPDLEFVDSEELDRNPDKYPPGTIGITDPEKSIKKPLIVNIEEPSADSGGTVDWRGTLMKPYPKSRSVDPGGSGKKAKMK